MVETSASSGYPTGPNGAVDLERLGHAVGPSRSTSAFRPELEGLRGVAILLVVAGHAGITGAGAGFVGVDVFFVLSGFLITGLLVDEHERTGRIELGAFYARRARRILPAAAVVLVATLAAATVVMSPLDFARIAHDGLAAGLSVANIRFAIEATDYFSPTDPSPMLHYWSLSIEEQFYLFWPALVLLATRLRAPRLMLAVVTGVVLVGSLLLCVAISPENNSLAYFLLPTRAWQLAAGGVLALAVRGPVRLPWPFAAFLGWAGAGLIAASMLVIGPTMPYPGVAATLPTAGTLALIASRGALGSPGRLLLRRVPLRWLGRISYSLYLWHWPVMVLGTTVLLGGPDTPPVLLGTPSILKDGAVTTGVLIGVSVGLAAVTWRLVEEPFRVGRLSSGGRRRALAVAIAAIMSVTIASTALSSVVERELATAAIGDPGTDLADGWGDADWSSDGPSASPHEPEASGSQAVPSPSAKATAVPKPAATPKPRPVPHLEGPLPAGLRPSLTAARDDEDPLMRDGCALALDGTEPPDCAYGDRHGAFTVALVGDSHAMNWFPAFERVAERHHWRLVPYTKYSCVFVDMPIWSDHLDREYTECEAWRTRVVAKLRRLKPDLVVISSNKWFAPIRERDGEPKRQGAALAAYIDRIPGKVAVLVDTPRSDHDVPACLARNRTEIERCTTPKAAAFGWRHRIREIEARRLSGAPLIDLSKAVCPSDPCPAIIGRRIVYRDHHHLTATFAASLARDLDAAITKVLAR
jgi:peptidoglycan/LPS O-acetylase OafA/YrhL